MTDRQARTLGPQGPAEDFKQNMPPPLGISRTIVTAVIQRTNKGPVMKREKQEVGVEIQIRL